MAKRMKDLKRDSIDFGKTKIEPLFHSIFFPTLLSMVFASLFTVADGIFVGQGVGSDALAAINIVAPLFLMTTGISLMFGVGVSVVASIHLSQGNTKAADINITQAIEVGSLLMAIAVMAVYLFRIPFLRMLGCSDALMPLALEYLILILPGCVFIISQLVGTFVIRLDGSPKYAASLEIIPGLMNIFLDWLFVFPLQMGIGGSALASTLSCAAASAMVMSDAISCTEPLILMTVMSFRMHAADMILAQIRQIRQRDDRHDVAGPQSRLTQRLSNHTFLTVP
jgi:Na+-driven multidrug efflux pump